VISVDRRSPKLGKRITISLEYPAWGSPEGTEGEETCKTIIGRDSYSDVNRNGGLVERRKTSPVSLEGKKDQRMGSDFMVWDLETVPDLDGFARSNDLVGKSPTETRTAMGDDFPKLIYHSIVCISPLQAKRSGQSCV
jgi:hypothetical protein